MKDSFQMRKHTLLWNSKSPICFFWMWLGASQPTYMSFVCQTVLEERVSQILTKLTAFSMYLSPALSAGSHVLEGSFSQMDCWLDFRTAFPFPNLTLTHNSESLDLSHFTGLLTEILNTNYHARMSNTTSLLFFYYK